MGGTVRLPRKCHPVERKKEEEKKKRGSVYYYRCRITPHLEGNHGKAAI
jgi:hypothetical protein